MKSKIEIMERFVDEAMERFVMPFLSILLMTMGIMSLAFGIVYIFCLVLSG